MKKTFIRRRALATLSFALLGAGSAQAQTPSAYITQPIKSIAPYPAYGGTGVREKIEAMGPIPGAETIENFAKAVKSDADIDARIIRDVKITLN